MQLPSSGNFVPEYYHGSLDMEVLVQEIDALFKGMSTNLTQLLDNQFVQTADADGVARFERLFDIRASATDTLEFRKERLINRFTLAPPFTLPFLRSRLDIIIGKGRYNVEVDYNKRRLVIGMVSKDQSWFQELRITLMKIKPANLVYVNKPDVKLYVDLTESSNYVTVEDPTELYKYLLGEWELGEFPFMDIDYTEVLKLPVAPSIQAPLLAANAAFTATEIASVRINGTEVLTDFEVKEGDGDTTVLEYMVPILEGASITQIELLNAAGAVLSSTPCYVPRDEFVFVQHTIKFAEGGDIANGNETGN